MRTMIVTMMLPLAALVGVEVFTRTANVSATPAVVATTPANASCRVDGSGRLRLIDPSGDRVLAESHQFSTTRTGGVTAHAAMLATGLDVLVCSEAGNVLHRGFVSESELTLAGSVMKVRLLSSTRAFVELHVNPSMEYGVLLDLRTGEVRKFEGHHFTTSPDGKDVAYFREPPHFSQPGSGEQAAVYVNDKKLADIPRGAGLGLRWHEGRTVTASVQAWNGAEEAYELKPF